MSGFISTPLLQVPGHLNTLNTSSNSTHGFASDDAVTPNYLFQTLIALFLILIIHCLGKYFLADLPPLGSGLKALPGPISTLPYVGRVHDVDRKAAWRSMKKFSDKYNGLFSLTLGGETHIWISREDIANDLLCKNADISSGRADLGAYPQVTQQMKYLPLMGYTDSFHRQRRFAVSNMTINSSHNYHGHIGLEMKRFMHELLNASEQDAFFDLTTLFCVRITARLAYGSADSASGHVKNSGEFIRQLGPAGPITNLLPFLQYFPEFLVPGKRVVRLRQEFEESLWKTLFEDTKSKYEKGELGQLPTYVSAALESKDGGAEGKKLFDNEEEAVFAVGMFCTVAIFTIAGALNCFIMAMVLNPEWQDKVRDEVDNAVGQGSMVDLGHRSKLPTLRAAMKECLRWRSTVPLGVPRLLEKDYVYDGYHFPKHSVVHITDAALSHDPKRYVDPQIYNPDRWLNPESRNFRAPLTEYPRLKGHHIFGRGRRACPGQDLVESELLVFCGNLLKYFKLGPKVEIDGNGRHMPVWPDPENWGEDVIGGPARFECDIRVRDEGARADIESKYREAFPGATK